MLMASILHGLQLGCRPRAVQIASRSVFIQRGIHQTAIALKKKQKNAVADDGDLFGSVHEEDSLFADDLSGSSEGPSSDAAAPKPRTPSDGVSRRLNPDERLKRFKELRQFVADRIGPKPVAKLPPVRNAAWQHLFDLATTKEQMEEVVELFPRWRDSKREFNANNAEAFVRRCEELQCPTLALNVFSDHPKYGFDLSSLRAARRLLHSLHIKHPLQETITLAALFRVYNLPPISTDLVSCAMLTSACFKHGTRESLTVAREMVPHLKAMLQNVEPKTMATSRDNVERARVEEKEKVWLRWTLNKVEKALRKQGADFDWLHQWRTDSGHATMAS